MPAKPFDLDRALAGDPVETVGGIRVVVLAYRKAWAPDSRLVVEVPGYRAPVLYPESGRRELASLCLQMAPLRKTLGLRVWYSAQLGGEYAATVDGDDDLKAPWTLVHSSEVTLEIPQ